MASGLFNLKQVNQAISQGAWSGYIAPRWVEYLVVAGGGGGGGGGAGAGGLLTGIVTVSAGASYSVTVGAGGAVNAGTGAVGNVGFNSVFGSISAAGGGAGGADNANGGNGGSGGGPGASSSGFKSGGSAVAGQGNAGGNNAGNTAFPYSASGGGGAGTVGLNAPIPQNFSGNGGAGIASSITGSVTTYAGGGGGGGTSLSAGGAGGAGGVGGGGTGGYSVAGTAGSVNTGGGGGGAGTSSLSGAGGSGIVVVRYPGNVVFFTGGTVNYNNGYIIHIFTSNGTLAPAAPAPYNTSYQISRSLRFNSADSAYLNRTPASAGNRKTWTYSAWVKRGSVSTNQYFLSNLDNGGNSGLGVQFVSDGTLHIFDYGASSYVYELSTTPVYRDPSAWYHFVITFDTTQATSSNRVKLYVNSVQQTAFSIASYPTLNYDGYWNNTSLATISRAGGLSTQYFDGYVTEVNFIDGQALTPSSFGATSTTTGVWSPIQYTGSYGTNGFYVNFSDNSNTTAATLGADYSGNGNNWTPNNFSVTAGVGNDSMVDSPTQYGFDTGVGGTVRGNYSTMNPLDNSGMTLSNGNLAGSHTGNNGGVRGSVGISSGKWYWEMTITAVGSSGQGNLLVGIATNTVPLADNTNANLWSYWGGNGNKFNTSSTAYGATFGNGDVIGIAFDADAGSITFYKNNVSQGVAFSSIPAGTYLPWFNSGGGGPTYDTSWATNFGQRPFAYTAPSGFKALCTQNLPTPAIGATSNTLATQFFAPVLWTGDSTNPRTITGVGFQPDWVWVKRRDGGSNNFLQDSVRGVTSTDSRSLVSNNTDVETNFYPANGGVTAFTSDGFTTSGGSTNLNINGSGQAYIAWNWRAGNNAGASNSAGSVTSTVSANTTSGFSVVTWTGSSAGQTVGHGLGVAPSLIIAKTRNNAGENWPVYHKDLGIGNYLFLGSTAAANSTYPTYWGSSAPTSTIFGTFTGGYPSANNYGNMVAYCFAEVAGYSKIGTYTGNSSADGPFVYCGFRPAFVMIKASSLAGESWYIVDATRSPYNAATLYLVPNSTGAEASPGAGQFFDFVSNGFKLRVSGAYSNASGETYIYMAFASNPFKYSLAR
jgi:hypothetical protein